MTSYDIMTSKIEKQKKSKHKSEEGKHCWLGRKDQIQSAAEVTEILLDLTASLHSALSTFVVCG